MKLRKRLLAYGVLSAVSGILLLFKGAEGALWVVRAFGMVSLIYGCIIVLEACLCTAREMMEDHL